MLLTMDKCGEKLIIIKYAGTYYAVSGDGQPVLINRKPDVANLIPHTTRRI
jgi:hypothetical protein